MGDVVRFKKRPRNSGQFRGQGRWTPSKKPKRPKWGGDGVKLALSLAGLVSLAGLWWSVDKATAQETFTCEGARVIDGDTFDCGGRRVRMQGIDAPELPGHCRPGRSCTPGDPYASTANLSRLLAATPVECRKTDTDAYGRTVARCTAGKVDLSCRQIEGGFAVRRYSPIVCW